MDYYTILKIDKHSNTTEIKKHYYKLAKKYHPDKLGDVGDDVKTAAEEKFRQVQEAYEKLNK